MRSNVVDVLVEVRVEVIKADVVVRVVELKEVVGSEVVVFLFDTVETEMNATVIILHIFSLKL